VERAVTFAGYEDITAGIVKWPMSVIRLRGSDPDRIAALADKILTISGMICLVELGRIPSWIVVIIVAREFIISGFRLVAAENGVVIAANYWGKFKTTFQMIMIILMIMNIPQLQIVTNIVMWIALALTLISLWTYIMANKQVLAGDK
jgi:CDP-diacylglycerol--glycerol-3-phosphate 3-phosphatidyltransferase